MWGFKDLTPLIPLLQHTLESFEKEIFELSYHSPNQSRSEVLSWPPSTRRYWRDNLIEQRKREDQAIKNATKR